MTRGIEHGAQPSGRVVPPTLNLHIIGACDYECAFCFRNPGLHKAEPRLSRAAAAKIMREFKALGGRRVRFAGGEPTLHPELLGMLMDACAIGLVTSLVTHGRHIDAAWLARHLPWLRWLTLSVDSDSETTSSLLGRRRRGLASGHVAHVERVAHLLHEWNARRPASRRVALGLNMTVTALNAHENPADYIRRCRPTRVERLQMRPVAAEYDQAVDLVCSDALFDAYVQRLLPLSREGIRVIPESNELMDGSYAMIDSFGRFFQRRDGRYVVSRPVPEVGMMPAFKEVGGYSPERFVNRGGEYDPGAVPDGNRPYLIAIEGLDGSGKSTVARVLAARLGAVLLKNPPGGLAEERAVADASPEAARRAWYVHANRLTAGEARQHQAAGRAVVVDRSVASTLAFGAACSGRAARFEEWPQDVPRPDLLVLLEVSEAVRIERLRSRSEAETEEEARLRADVTFRECVLAGYIALGAIRVLGDGALDGIVDHIAGLLA